MNILVVCTGNICRSPMGEIVLQSQLDEAGIAGNVTSAGVSTEETGNPIDRRAQAVLREHGYDIPRDHYAHQATPAELLQADLVLAMTTGHARSLRRMMINAGLGEEHISRIHLWREFDGTVQPADAGAFGSGGPLEGKEKVKPGRGSDFYTSDGELDVLDPWYGDASGFYDTLAMIEAGARGIVEWIRE
ncbi:low molecular weight protein-tyrosine-phosphatase [Arcanobacterium buesumense]|uniref:protein-tyrosine-phosphatase n=1 Tax=Arcanobacterium buesumense TaxID=2722751 RepID=A0A6H2EKJ0_9ACTO|nr:low molecular weight protein-tyrosine-phosphatase [Arcanobacterium buesumense]QJC21162.1 low molecular weight phosphotyrosine protein phosphatase [Arcanobacterium buesumense]